MPKPKPSEESRADWMSRCIPVLIEEGKPQDQAIAICSSMWSEAKTGEKALDFEGVIFTRGNDT